MARAVLHELTLDGEAWMVIAYPPAVPPALAVLTATEMAVVSEWLAGKSMRDIADARGVSARTIAKQIASAYAKLGVSSRTELVSLVHHLVGR